LNRGGGKGNIFFSFWGGKGGITEQNGDVRQFVGEEGKKKKKGPALPLPKPGCSEGKKTSTQKSR